MLSSTPHIQSLTARGMPWSEFFPGLQRAVREAPARHGLTAALILCFLRDLGPQAAADTLQQARRCRAGLGAEGHREGGS